jgi:DNA-binding CsgD family transcriptional regulator
LGVATAALLAAAGGNVEFFGVGAVSIGCSWFESVVVPADNSDVGTEPDRDELTEAVESLSEALDKADALAKKVRSLVGALRLTPREQQVCHSISQGMTIEQIAWQLGISEANVNVTRRRALKKLGVSSDADIPC